MFRWEMIGGAHGERAGASEEAPSVWTSSHQKVLEEVCVHHLKSSRSDSGCRKLRLFMCLDWKSE